MVRLILIFILLCNTAQANPIDTIKKVINEKKQVVEERIFSPPKEVKELKETVDQASEVIAETKKETATLKEKFIKVWDAFLILAVQLFQLLSTSWLLCRVLSTLEYHCWLKNMWFTTGQVAVYYIAEFLVKIKTGA